MLGNSEYGRFFVRKLDLWGLERRPEEWKLAQSGGKARGTTNGLKMQGVKDEQLEKENERSDKRTKQEEKGDEIDELFAGVEVKKRRKV